MLFIAGSHVPVIAFVEVVGNADKLAPEQIAVTCVNVGVTFGFTVKSLKQVVVPSVIVAL